ncbi:hypothetical protein [Pseudomonas sp. 11/12A]|uniref:hypothetical protein n=1 Tax=Pseudomonas sp. 11/12A TaxID=1506582 RepID=UPI00068FE026|nr:hypothetical protein [Pseudomonas sp. 11/12A]
MDISEIRQANLQHLMDERFEGAKVRIADALGKSPSYIARCLSKTIAPENRKKIGEDFARHIEEALGLPRYAMDEPLSSSPADMPAPTSDSHLDGENMKVLQSLKGIATPRSLDALRRIEKAALGGRLKEADLVLLEGIAARFEQLSKE